MMTQPPNPPSISRWLRVEHAALLALVVVIYGRVSGDWLAFALLLLLPDISMIGYVRGSTLGSVTYNAGHMLAAALAVIALGAVTANLPVLQIGLIWAAHILLDRALGYGLKYPTHFKDTHLQRV